MLTPRPINREELVYGIHWTGGWVCFRASVNFLGKRRITWPCRKSNPRWITTRIHIYDVIFFKIIRRLVSVLRLRCSNSLMDLLGVRAPFSYLAKLSEGPRNWSRSSTDRASHCILWLRHVARCTSDVRVAVGRHVGLCAGAYLGLRALCHGL